MHSNLEDALWGNTPPAVQTVTSAVQSSFKWNLWSNYTNNRANLKCVSTLLNTNNWTGFVNPTYADYAIGSPTIEMFFASWNNLYPTEMLSCNNTDSYGYLVGTPGNENYGAFSEAGMKARQGYSNTLYYPHPQDTYHSEEHGEVISNEFGSVMYLLASPGGYDQIYMYQISATGYIGCTDLRTLGASVRPVVRLKTGIELVTDTNGGCDYKISE